MVALSAARCNVRMTRRNQRCAYAVATLAAGVLLLGGCGSAKPEPGVASVGGTTASTAPADRDAQIRKYRDCLTQNGVKLLDTPTAEGLPQVDKQSTDVKVLGDAQEKCREYVPSGGDATRAPAADIETSRKYAACIRKHGVSDYPDPDPVTGDPGISDELGARLKTDPDMVTATEACAGLQPGGKGDVGA
jgi:hypothetical protein